MLQTKKNPLASMFNTSPTLSANPMLGNARQPKGITTSGGKTGIAVSSSPAMAVGAKSTLDLIGESFSDKSPMKFTEDDYLIIDFVDESRTKPYGDFVTKTSSRLACWEIRYLIRSIPSVYFSTPELEAATVATIMEEYDEYELIYIHQSYCDHKELQPLIPRILMGFLDPGTHLIAAEAKIIPRNISDFIKEHKGFDKTPDLSNAELHYHWDPEVRLNWSFLDRPSTSTPALLK